jgi:uncharacterized SAM-dependent methyltransferase
MKKEKNRNVPCIKGYSATIHTENSYKYTLEQIQDLADDSCFQLRKNFLDRKRWFDLAFLSPQ